MINLQSIYKETISKIVSSEEQWKTYLKFGAQIHKYPFDQAVLVYAQNPDVTMLASADIWNRFKRNIIPNSKAILVYKYEQGQRLIEYLFDISQTTGSQIDKPVWYIQDDERDYILNALSNGENNTSLEVQMDIFVKEVVKDVYLNVEDHCEEIFSQYTGDKKEQYWNSFMRLVISSTQYAVREKSGLLQVEENYDFSFIKETTDLSKINILGYLVSTSTKQAMSEIAQLKKNFKLERVEENVSRTNLSEERGPIIISEHTNQQQSGTRQTIGNVRPESADLPTREESNTVFGITNERDINGKNAQSGPGSERQNSRLDGGIEENESTTENRQSIGENKSPKLVESPSRRDNLERVRRSNQINENTQKILEPDSAKKETGSFLLPKDEQLELELFNDWDSIGEKKEEEQINLAKEETISSITQKTIDDVLIHGTGFENGKFRVIDFFATNPTDKEAITFLKNEYGTGGWGNSGHISVIYDSKGIAITESNVERTIKWSDVANRIKGLINLDRYLTTEEKLEIAAYHQQQEEKLDNNHSEQDESTSPSSVEVIEAEQPELPEVIPVQNYRYEVSDDLYPSGEKTKYKNNIAAIRLLKQLETNKEIANPEQQKILARYVGWGGLANVFNPDHEKWRNEYQELKTLLTEKEYQEAMESTLTAYYTDQDVVKKIYETLHNLGFEKGRILDPAMGTGNFFSILPSEMSDSQLFGVELDSITGRLAKQLYPKATIMVQGFETTRFKDNEFDVIIGNIPFNNIQVLDPRYDAHHFLIHDYFIAKSLDIVKPGGIVAVITSKGTMDKKNGKIREYMAERSELLDAIRLPNTAFKALAGTEATSDILFLKKRDKRINLNELDIKPNWLDTKALPQNGIEINNYFIENPNMMLGKIEHVGFYDGSRQYACVAEEGQDLIALLGQAIQDIKGSFSAKVENSVIDISNPLENEEVVELEVPPGIKNFTYTILDNNLYYYENTKLIPQKLSSKETERIKGLCEIRTALQDVIQIQSAPYEEMDLRNLQEILNEKYDHFVKKFGYINDRSNQRAFFEDDQLPLLLSIEDEQEDKTFKKSAVFYKATIRPQTIRDYAESPQEALEMSLNRNMKVDISYMASLCKSSPEDIIQELGDTIYLNPEKYIGDITKGWEISDEYLTGNVYDKLNYARLMAEKNPELFERNVQALEDVQPPRLLPGDISYRIGSPWIPKEYYEEFMYELLGTSPFHRSKIIKIEYMEFTNTWKINGKNSEDHSVKVTSVYGTKRRNAYQIIEDCLNLQDATVRDKETYYDQNGKEQIRYVVNPKETMIARSKQQQIQEAFSSWLFKDSTRSEHLLDIYNSKYNIIRPRTYDGSHLNFPEMNEEMKLRPHQKNVVARILSTGRSLMAHEVGAGKTAAMIAAGVKLKQIGASKKPMFVVMNHTIDQWAKEILRFYPGANVLVATKKDFEKKNRQRFVSKIATGDYDAIVIGHSQFEKIPISKERQENMLRKEINTISYEIKQAKKEQGNDWSVKQLVAFQKSLKNNLEKLVNEPKKDQVINFEDLGVDTLFVDEAHVYKNLYTVTKLKNVAGIGTSSSQRATDMKMKCEYIQEQNQGRGVIFATGTPITNSMSELFVMQRFLQPDVLNRAGLEFFDNWAGTFGEVVSSLEMTPEGSGYRMKSRFSKFHNLPELMNMFNMVADIQTSDMLQLPVPELEGGKAQIIISECSDFQKSKMDEFVERSVDIRDGVVDPTIDNMLKLTHEAKLMAIDPRLIDENAPINEQSKLNMCVKKVFEIWNDTKENKSTQMIFCDSGTPKPNQFNVYDEIKTQLISKGIPSDEIAFIHDAKTDVQRDKLFAKMRKGEVRVLLGSTSKVGTGTNVQDLLIAGHHIDCPWRPADLTQRDGRILRQGNQNEKVAIYRYVTKGTFDGYLWQIQEQKLKYISQVMTNKNISRSCDDSDETVLTAAEVKAIATDNPLLLEKMTLDNEVNRLKLVRNRWSNEKATMEKNLTHTYPKRIEAYQKMKDQIEKDLQIALQHRQEEFSMQLDGITFIDRKEAGQAFKTMISTQGSHRDEQIVVGNLQGLEIYIKRTVFNEYIMGLQGEYSYEAKVMNDDRNNICRLEKLIEDMPQKIGEVEENIEQVKSQIEQVKEELKNPFSYEDQLNELLKKQSELNLKMEFEEEINKQEKAPLKQKKEIEVFER